jgi:hypothetical protein
VLLRVSGREQGVLKDISRRDFLSVCVLLCCRSLLMVMARLCTCLTVTAVCSGDTRRSLRRHLHQVGQDDTCCRGGQVGRGG